MADPGALLVTASNLLNDLAAQDSSLAFRRRLQRYIRPRLLVKDELRSFLACGIFAHGFARFRCASCGHSRLVPFSCRGRGF